MAKPKNDDLKAAANTNRSFVITPPQRYVIGLEVMGLTDLIQNNFSQKSMEQMLKKHMGMNVHKETKKPREVIENAKILNTDGRICLPPQGFKAAMLTASMTQKTFKKTQLRIALFVAGSSIPITYEEMVPRVDMVRTAGINRTPDVRFRPQFTKWKARLLIEISDLISAQSAVDLLNLAGAVGVGEWRPEKNGTFGTFRVVRHIDDPKELAEVQSQCAVPLVGLRVPEWAMDQDIDPTILQKIVGQTAEEHHAIDESNEEESETLKEENPEALAGAHKALRSNGSNGQPSA